MAVAVALAFLGDLRQRLHIVLDLCGIHAWSRSTIDWPYSGECARTSHSWRRDSKMILQDLFISFLLIALQSLWLLCAIDRLCPPLYLHSAPCVSQVAFCLSTCPLFLNPTSHSVVAILITVVGAFITDYIGRESLFLGSTLVTWCCYSRRHGTDQDAIILTQTACCEGRVSWRSLGDVLSDYSCLKSQVFFALVWRMGSTLLGDLGWS
jgi:hypothetical protein